MSHVPRMSSVIFEHTDEERAPYSPLGFARSSLSANQNQFELGYQGRTYLLKNMKPQGLLLVCVQSAGKNFAQRGAIRRTWGSGTKYPFIRVKVVFFVGAGDGVDGKMSAAEVDRKVADEVTEHGDVVVLEKHKDAFETIWLKTFVILKSGALVFSGLAGGEDAQALGSIPVKYLMK